MLVGIQGDAYFYGSLAEPMSCIVGAFHANYHTQGGSYVHQMGIREGGKMAILAGVGPWDLAQSIMLFMRIKTFSLVVVTDIDEDRLARAARFIPLRKPGRTE